MIKPMVRTIGGYDLDTWSKIYSKRDQFRKGISWHIPSQNLIDCLVEHSPIVSVGSGLGFTEKKAIISGANIVMTDPDFKFPQIFRTNLAFDKRFGQGWLFSMEAIYTKDLNAVRMRNANEKPTNGILTGSDARGRFAAAGDRRLYSNITSAVILENTNKGGGFSFTTAMSKSFANGFYGSFAYTYTTYNEVTSNPGSQASSAWNSNPNVGTQNALEMYNSAYVIPHRIIGTISYRKE